MVPASLLQAMGSAIYALIGAICGLLIGYGCGWARDAGSRSDARHARPQSSRPIVSVDIERGRTTLRRLFALAAARDPRYQSLNLEGVGMSG